ncbi:MAG TPA: type IV pili methyl-accepting chemotaxis transducer N-terminal domain-containing protein, partial [Plasticicumulans sp.]|nr:type IV pili methyl-accepting chemotaxis transducer N-terminal domain-containing protein [Plasticicumulans sp.]
MLSAPTAAPERSPRLLAAITLFVLFDLLVLAVNFWITWQVEHDALAINVAGRQRMLTQRIAKSLLLLGRPEDATQARRDLRAAKELFGETLAAFEAGGHVRDGDGVEQPFRALE